MPQAHVRAAVVGFLLVTALLGAACADGAPPTAPAADSVLSHLTPLTKGPVSISGLQAILGTPDLDVGEHRVGFLLTSREGFVKETAVTVTPRFVGGRPAAAGEPVPARFNLWPFGVRAMYTTRLTFDRPGTWALAIAVGGAAGPRTAELEFPVVQKVDTPEVGTPAIRSASKTLADVASIAQLTTGSLQDPELYETTIADAVSSGRPTVIVFASPAFCTNEACGPQVEVLHDLKEAYRGAVNFVHVDFYDNPQELQGDRDLARVSPTVLEWRLPSIEWSFVVDRNGLIAARFEAFATYDELEEALRDVL